MDIQYEYLEGGKGGNRRQEGSHPTRQSSNKESKSVVGRKPPTDMATCISIYQHIMKILISNSRSTLTLN
jgi:hypothetical protein